MRARVIKMNVYEVITAHILDTLARGVVPWRKPWNSDTAPKNLISKKEYRGVNVLLLSSSPAATTPWWLTYHQAKQLSGNVRKGEKGTPCIFFSTYEKKDGNKGAVMRYYTVFNVSQCEGIEVPAPKAHLVFNPIEACERIVHMFTAPRGPSWQVGTRACYAPMSDTITMPAKENFHSVEEYYSTAFHEMIHASGAKGRLDREGITNPIKFGSHSYSKEELIAEIGACMLAGVSGIESSTIENSAAYIASWSKALKDDPKMIVEAASAAAKACDLIRGVSAKKEETDDEAEAT
jgi:antirestriction protein ArdC